MPELLKLGLPASTRLVASTAYSYRVKPGAVVLPEVGPCGVSMEAWSRSKGGAPYLYDFSFAYGDVDFYAVGAAHAGGVRFWTPCSATTSIACSRPMARNGAVRRCGS